MTSEYHLKRSFIFVATVALFMSSTESIRIYDNLIHCYRGNDTQPWVGASMRLLIELIEKIEQQIPTNIDIRHLVTNIFHELRLDGIERTPGVLESDFVTPYRATGIQVYKFDLLRNLISHTSQKLNFENYLTKTEICYLHKLISASVEPYIRGDEVRTCPVTRQSGNGPSRPDPYNRNRPHVNITYVGGSKSPTVLSPCPLEQGVVRTFEFGSLTPGTLIGAIAAGLQPQNVKTNDLIAVHIKHNPYENLETMDPKDTRKAIEKLFTSIESVDNTFAAGLSGDLAEVCVYQSPALGMNVSIGMSGHWNSSYFPRWRYLPENHQSRWEMTDAEILADIDSHFISQHINSWVNRIHRLRLSQIIQMYYSHQYGIPSITIENANKNNSALNTQHSHDNKHIKSEAIRRDVEEIDVDFIQSRILESPNKVERFQKYVNEISSTDGINRACHRKAILQTIDMEKLKEETYRFAQILQYAATSIVDEGQMRRVCDATVDKFFDKANELVRKMDACKSTLEDFRIPNVDLTLVMDGSRPMYESQELIFHIAEMLQLNPKGSHLSVVHGMTGYFMVNRTDSIANVFEQLRNFTDPYPIRLSLSNVLLKVVDALSNQTVSERERYIYGAPAQVMLVVSQGVRMNQEEFETSKRLMQSTLIQFPDLYYIFLTDHKETFVSMKGNDFGSNEKYKIIESRSTSIETFTKQLKDTIKTIPKRIISPYCRNKGGQHLWSGHTIRDDFEDFITPQEEIRYRIHPYYFDDEFQLQFQGLGYGDFTVCMSRGQAAQSECRNVVDMEYNWFSFYDVCRGNNINCESIYFTVTLDKSYVKCSEQECRFPYQVKYLVKPVGLRCEINAKDSANKNSALMLMQILSVIYLLFQ